MVTGPLSAPRLPPAPLSSSLPPPSRSPEVCQSTERKMLTVWPCCCSSLLQPTSQSCQKLAAGDTRREIGTTSFLEHPTSTPSPRCALTPKKKKKKLRERPPVARQTQKPRQLWLRFLFFLYFFLKQPSKRKEKSPRGPEADSRGGSGRRGRRPEKNPFSGKISD